MIVFVHLGRLHVDYLPGIAEVELILSLVNWILRLITSSLSKINKVIRNADITRNASTALQFFSL